MEIGSQQDFNNIPIKTNVVNELGECIKQFPARGADIGRNLFINNNIDSIYITWYNVNNDSHSWRDDQSTDASICFTQGNISGTKKFKGTSIQDILLQIFNFCSTL